MNRIVWRPWKDPISHMLKTSKQEEDEGDEDFEEAAAEFGKVKEYAQRPRSNGDNSWSGPAIVLGGYTVPVHESNLPSELFNLWMGDTNFDLSRKVLRTIEEVNGVETLDVYTRYRFRLGVGRAFKQEEVRAAVEAALCPPPLPKRSTDPLVTAAALSHPHWAVIRLPDGRRKIVGGLTAEEAKDKAFAGDDCKVEASSWEA